jgi:ketosteroid isomerase-like protein
MTPTESLLKDFYTAFQNKDYATMQAAYASGATFSDPVFPHLDEKEVKAMWEMFCKTGKDLKVTFGDITADDEQGAAQWTATYTFSATGRRVVNDITASFVFRDGRILRHTDHFSFHHWAGQALGPMGALLGWTPMVKQKVRKTAAASLRKFMSGK